MEFERDILEKLIKKALSDLYEKDKYLIINKPAENLQSHVSERAIVFRFGIYLENLLSQNTDLMNYNLDCEYNRSLYNKKTLPNFKNGVFPDLIIHKRGDMEHNLLVMEIKTWWNSNNETDIKKIGDFVNPNGTFRYQYGASIHVNQQSPDLNWMPVSGGMKRE